MNVKIVSPIQNRQSIIEEIQRMDPLRSNIPYNWDLKHG